MLSGGHLVVTKFDSGAPFLELYEKWFDAALVSRDVKWFSTFPEAIHYVTSENYPSASYALVILAAENPHADFVDSLISSLRRKVDSDGRLVVWADVNQRREVAVAIDSIAEATLAADGVASDFFLELKAVARAVASADD